MIEELAVKDWRNGREGGTRLNADALEDTEARFGAYVDEITKDEDAAVFRHQDEAVPFLVSRLRNRDHLAMRDHSAGKPTGDADNSEALGELLFYAGTNGLPSTIKAPAPDGGKYYNVNAISKMDNDRTTLKGDGEGSRFVQNLNGRMILEVTGDDCRVDDVLLGRDTPVAARPVWSYAERSAPENLLRNQDASSSRSAGLYVIGAQRFKTKGVAVRDNYCCMRIRPLNRFTTDPEQALVGIEVIRPQFERFVFGLNVMGIRQGRLVGGITRHTISVDTVPPHAIYLAGAGNVPVDVLVPGKAVTYDAVTHLWSTGASALGVAVGDPVEFDNLTGGSGEVLEDTIYYVASVTDAFHFTVSATPGGAVLNMSVNVTAGTVTNYPDLDDDGDSDLPAGKADWPMQFVEIAGWVDYDNPWSSSFKVRNGFKLNVHDMYSYAAAQGFQLSWLERCAMARLVARDGVQIRSQTTGELADTGTQEMLQMNFSSWNLLDDVALHSELGRFTSGLTLRNRCVHNKIRRPHVDLNVASDAGRSHYKLVGSDDNIFENPGIDLRGVVMTPIRSYTSQRNLFDRPRLDAPGLTVPRLAQFEDASLNNKLLVQRDRLSNAVSQATVITQDASSSGNKAVFPENVTPEVVALTDAATILTDSSLGSVYDVTLGGNRTMGAPTNPVPGKRIEYRFKQDGTGNRTIAWNAIFRFSDDIPTVTLSTIAGRLDRVAFEYRAADDRWDCIGVVKGYA